MEKQPSVEKLEITSLDQLEDDVRNALLRLKGSLTTEALAILRQCPRSDCRDYVLEFHNAIQELFRSLNLIPEDPDAEWVPKLYVRKLFDDGTALSPINSPLDVSTAIRRTQTELGRRTLPGLEIREPEQLAYLELLGAAWSSGAIPWPRYRNGREESKALAEKGKPELSGSDRTLRFAYDNTSFTCLDAQLLAAVILKERPKRILAFVDEVRYALILDVLGRAELETECVFVEPDPDRLEEKCGPLPAGSRHRILCSQPQTLDATLYAQLGPGDLLVTSTTHVAKAASDVQHLFHQVLPGLSGGVLVHMHSVFWPFEYPPGWLTEGRSWNEAYVLRAFLTYNSVFEIQLFSDYLNRFQRERLYAAFPMAEENSGGSLWLRKREGLDQRRGELLDLFGRFLAEHKD